MKKVVFTLITSLAFVISASISVMASPLAYPIERIAGQDRIETALSISQKGWDSADTIILSEYAAFPDSIASTPFAVSLNAPILLTPGNKIDQRVLEEIKRLQPSKVVILGGTGVLKPVIEEELGKLDMPLVVERIGGINRYETSILLAQRVPSDTVILANGDNFPDALSAASFAGIKQIPIVLTSKKMPESVLNYLSETQPGQIIVIGGEGVIPSEGLTEHSFTIDTRLGGQNRYETNAAVVSHVKDSYETDDLFLASGINFPDAVAGTVLASKYKAPLLLTEKEDIPTPVYTYLREHMKVEPPRKTPEPPKDNTPVNKAKQGKIAASGGLNLRESPSSSGAKIITIPQGTLVTILEEQTGWYKTTYESQTGWVTADYITLVDNSSDTNANPPKPAQTQPKGEGIITPANGLNLRSTPSSSGEKLVTIPKDTKVQILADQSGWYKVTYQSFTGWIAADYVSLTTPPAPKMGLITATNGLNLRATASSTGDKLATIPVDTTVEIIEEQEGWYKVSFEAHSGWVARDYVEIIENINEDIREDSETEESSSEGNPPTEAAPPSEDTLPEITIDLSPNGNVYILGGSGVISTTAQSIIEGKASSKYQDNLRDFPPLPAEIISEEPPQEEIPENPQEPNQPTQPTDTDYDPSQEILVDPFVGIPENAFAGKIIMIDPGHGGPDPGAVGPSKTYEKNNTLPIALALKDYLIQAGAEVLMTREDDRSPSTASKYTELEDLKARVALANSCNADLFISIHNDSFTNSAVNGTSVYYSSANPMNNESLHLASNVRTSLISTINTRDRGVKHLGFYVLSNTKIPAILVETAFISNPYEEARLQNPIFRQNVAAGLFKGIYAYYTTPIPKD